MKRVKSIIKKMHGLNVLQTGLIPSALLTIGAATGNSQLAQVYVNGLDDPTNISAMYLAFYGSNAAFVERELYTKRWTCTWRFSNVGNMPCYLEVYTFRARTNIPVSQNLLSLLESFSNNSNGQNPGYDDAYVSPLTSHEFQQTFKIVSSKTRLLVPGSMVKVRRVSRLMLGKPFTEFYEGATLYNYIKGNTVLFVRVVGIPTAAPEEIQTGNPFGACLLPARVLVTFKRYWSWYTMDDAIPNSAVIPSYGGQVALGTANGRATLLANMVTDFPTTRVANEPFILPTAQPVFTFDPALRVTDENMNGPMPPPSPQKDVHKKIKKLRI